MKKSEVNKYPIGSFAYVLAHAKWSQDRGRKPSMSYGKIRNPKKALEDAEFDCLMNEQDKHYKEQDRLLAESENHGPLFRNFAGCVARSNGLFLDDIQLETFFWEVVIDDVKNFNLAIDLLGLYRNDLAKKIAAELVGDMSGEDLFRAFIEMVPEEGLTDSKIETLFWKIIEKCPEKFGAAIDVLREHRSELAFDVVLQRSQTWLKQKSTI